MSEPATSPAATVGTGRLHAVDGTASGTVSLLHLADGSFEVSFEYLSVASAAHTDVILVTNVDVLKTSEIDRKAILDLGSLKGTSGMQEYPIPASASSASMGFHTVVLMGHGDGPRRRGRSAEGDTRQERVVLGAAIIRRGHTIGAMAALDRPILVVDDDEKILRLVRMYLEREGFAVLDAKDGQAALASVALNDPALVILDLMLPEVDGLSVLRTIRRQSSTPVIVLSARGTTSDRIEGLETGADDYVRKPFSPAELVLRVKRVLQRSAAEQAPGPPPARLIVHGDLVMDLDRHDVMIAGRNVPLTTAEFRLLAALLDANGRVLTREQLLDALHGLGEADVLDRAIDAHIRRLRDKLEDEPERPRYVATVRGVGYRAAAAPPAPGPPPAAPAAAAAAERATE
ncbi:MAG TPA: response regulator transcription factor [Candidatus Saccharimonadales bacterium]|nr:response regulator transcription factor [Candidatus Saccharimonadales bacterium]